MALRLLCCGRAALGEVAWFPRAKWPSGRERVRRPRHARPSLGAWSTDRERWGGSQPVPVEYWSVEQRGLIGSQKSLRIAPLAPHPWTQDHDLHAARASKLATLILGLCFVRRYPSLELPVPMCRPANCHSLKQHQPRCKSNCDHIRCRASPMGRPECLPWVINTKKTRFRPIAPTQQQSDCS